MSSMIEYPSGSVPEKAPRWDLTRTEACDGRKSVRVALYWFGNIWESIEVELGQMELRGSHELKGRTL